MIAFSGPASLNECKFTTAHTDGKITFDAKRLTVSTQHVNFHRVAFHSDTEPYDIYEQTLTWTCAIPTCLCNLLRLRILKRSVLRKQKQLQDTLEELVTAMSEISTHREIVKSAKRDFTDKDNIVKNEISNKFSLIHNVFGEAFPNARFPASLRNR
jgi:hypothetical protein